MGAPRRLWERQAAQPLRRHRSHGRRGWSAGRGLRDPCPPPPPRRRWRPLGRTAARPPPEWGRRRAGGRDRADGGGARDLPPSPPRTRGLVGGGGGARATPRTPQTTTQAARASMLLTENLKRGNARCVEGERRWGGKNARTNREQISEQLPKKSLPPLRAQSACPTYGRFSLFCGLGVGPVSAQSVERGLGPPILFSNRRVITFFCLRVDRAGRPPRRPLQLAGWGVESFFCSPPPYAHGSQRERADARRSEREEKGGPRARGVGCQEEAQRGSEPRRTAKLTLLSRLVAAVYAPATPHPLLHHTALASLVRHC